MSLIVNDSIFSGDFNLPTSLFDNSDFNKILTILKPGNYKRNENIIGVGIIEADSSITYDILNNVITSTSIILTHPVLNPIGLVRVVKYYINNDKIIYESKSYDKYKNIISSRSGYVYDVTEDSFKIHWSGNRMITQMLHVNITSHVKRVNNEIKREQYDDSNKLIASQTFYDFKE